MDVLEVLPDSWYYKKENWVEEIITCTTEIPTTHSRKIVTSMKISQKLLTAVELKHVPIPKIYQNFDNY